MATGAPSGFGGGYAVSRAPTIGRAIRRVGFVLVVAALVPAALAGVAVAWTGGVGGVLAALSSDGVGIEAAFRLSIGVAAAGCWCVGLGLLVEGLFGGGD